MTRILGGPATWLVLLMAALAATSGPAVGQSVGSPVGAPQRVPVEGGGAYTDVRPPALVSMLKAKQFPLINVHIPYEGEIEGTDQFIPFDQRPTWTGSRPTRARGSFSTAAAAT